MGRHGGSLRSLVCLFCVGLLVSLFIGGTEAAPALAAAKGSPKDLQGSSRGIDPLYTSKRRVPNGADPIHNRRAGKSDRPTGRV